MFFLKIASLIRIHECVELTLLDMNGEVVMLYCLKKCKIHFFRIYFEQGYLNGYFTYTHEILTCHSQDIYGGNTLSEF